MPQKRTAKTKKQWLTESQKLEICALGESGILIKDIAKIVGICAGSVNRILLAAGIHRYSTKRTWRNAHKDQL